MTSFFTKGATTAHGHGGHPFSQIIHVIDQHLCEISAQNRTKKPECMRASLAARGAREPPHPRSIVAAILAVLPASIRFFRVWIIHERSSSGKRDRS
jgi:hypothetical protein